MDGIIFDIKRFATHDGSGIRTTVFLKGCTMKCVWCQNPEGISIEKKPLYFKSKCIKCRVCEKFLNKNGTVYGAIFENKNIKRRDTDFSEIVENCPADAVQYDCKSMSSDELIKIVLRDRAFFNHGGGVTFSGGEPLMQSDFLLEVLKKLKEEGIDTAIETALNVDRNILEKVLPYLDSVYADLKIFNEENHKKYTGVSNKKIKENIEFLLTSDKKDNVIIRTPMIPDFTAYEKNIQEISEYISKIYPQVKYEILNYNPLAESKYELLGEKYCFEENKPLYTKEQMKSFGQTAKENGIKKIIIES